MMSLSGGLAIVALVVALAQLERKGVLQGMFSRPIVLGAVLGVVFKDPASGLLLGAALELLWLGGINVGANLPDNEAVGTCAVIGAALLAAGGEPVSFPLASLSLVLLAPLAVLGRRLDARIERGNVAILHLAERRLSAGGAPGSVNLLGLLAPPAAGVLVAVGGAGAGAVLLPLVCERLPSSAIAGLELAFPMLVAACAAVSISSIRSERAHLFGAVAAALALVFLTARVLWGNA